MLRLPGNGSAPPGKTGSEWFARTVERLLPGRAGGSGGLLLAESPDLVSELALVASRGGGTCLRSSQGARGSRMLSFPADGWSMCSTVHRQGAPGLALLCEALTEISGAWPKDRPVADFSSSVRAQAGRPAAILELLAQSKVANRPISQTCADYSEQGRPD